MRLIAAFQKSMKENFRDWKILLMTLSIAPFFVVVFYLFMGTTTIRYNVTVCNFDKPLIMKDGKMLNAGADVAARLKELKLSNSESALNIIEAKDIESEKKALANKSTDILVVLPEDMSEVIKNHIEGHSIEKTEVVLYGDPTRSEYIMAAVLSDSVYRDYVDTVINKKSPVGLREVFIGGTGNMSNFDASVPSALIFAIIMVLFSATASFIKEIEKGTIRRLRLSRLTPFEFLTSISIAQIIINAVGIALTLATAAAFGFRPVGSYVNVIIVGTVASLSIIAISLILAAFCRNVNDVTILGNIPFFLLLFFSGGVFPIPKMKLFEFGSHVISINDLLPTTPATTALGKVLNLGMGIGDVGFELALILVLTLFYFAIGLWLFNKKHMKSI